MIKTSYFIVHNIPVTTPSAGEGYWVAARTWSRRPLICSPQAGDIREMGSITEQMGVSTNGGTQTGWFIIIPCRNGWFRGSPILGNLHVRMFFLDVCGDHFLMLSNMVQRCSTAVVCSQIVRNYLCSWPQPIDREHLWAALKAPISIA